LVGAGFTEVINISGGHTSLQRQARTIGFKTIRIELLPVESKSINQEAEKKEEKVETKTIDTNAPIVVDVRTVEEFEEGAYPDAINIPIDELMYRFEELGDNPSREITVYCATGARSAYAQRMLMQMGYANVKNGGGLSAMMARRNAKPSNAAPSNGPMVIDVRTPEEFYAGAYPNAINIPLDELHMRVNELGSRTRDITLYCASGARSAYGQRVLQQMGFTNVKNGGGIMQMMRRR
jgi:rhodanese-related sulfurtransferase